MQALHSLPRWLFLILLNVLLDNQFDIHHESYDLPSSYQMLQVHFPNDDWQIITTCDLTTTIAKPNWINTPIPVCCHQIWISWIFINSRNSKYLRRTFHSCCIHCTIWCYSIHRIILAYTTLIIINSHKINLCRCCL